MVIDKIQKNEILQLESIDTHQKADVSDIKRFMERWNADPCFREQVSIDPYKSMTCYGLKLDPEEIRALCNLNFSQEFPEKVSNSAYFKTLQEFTHKNRIDVIMKSIAASSREPRFKAWRERQIARAVRQFKKCHQDSILHAPICFELSKGCSVGCWFCAISAPQLSNIFIYNQENAKLWHEILELMKEILGTAASSGFCYWATDPFDNPDYEKYCCDFHNILGIFPSTTTAQSLKDPERTRAFLKLSNKKGCLLNNFSILSLKMLNEVHKEFSAEELKFVRLALQNKEANTIKANAGRTRERNLKKREKNSEFSEQGTIACVTGFLFNMVDRSVRLISPCNADDRWPLGFIVYDEGTFLDAEDLKALLERMMVDNMPLTVRSSDLISFADDLKYESLADGFQLSTKFKTFKFRNQLYLRDLGEVIHKGDKTAEDIAFLFNLRGVSSADIFSTLNLLFEKGVLDYEPKPRSSLL